MKCQWRGCTEILKGKQTKFCSRLCAIKQHTLNKRRKFKQKAVNLLGGKCCKCGYNKCYRALQFHHVNPKYKSFSLSSTSGSAKSWNRVKRELKKCILLCANCHAEEEQILNLGVTVNYRWSV